MGKEIKFRRVVGLVRSALFDSTGIDAVGVTNNRLNVNATLAGPSDLITPVFEFAQITGTFNVEATIVTHTVTAGKTFLFTGINFGGEADGEFAIFINSVKFLIFRNSAANRTEYLELSSNITASGGDIIDVKVINCNHRQNSALYEATLIGGER